MFPDQSSSILSTNLHYLYHNKTLKLSTNPPAPRERGKDQSKERQEKDSFRKANMVLLDQLWDDVLAGPHPEQGLGKLRKPLKLGNGAEGEGSKYQRSLSMPAGPSTPPTPGTPMTPSSAKKEDVWRSVFNPGRNLATKGIGAAVFDKPQANTPTVYDWLYSDDTRSKHR